VRAAAPAICTTSLLLAGIRADASWLKPSRHSVTYRYDERFGDLLFTEVIIAEIGLK
jgi:hypothetical protein